MPRVSMRKHWEDRPLRADVGAARSTLHKVATHGHVAIWAGFSQCGSKTAALSQQRTIPQQREQSLELDETLWPELGDPLAFDVAENVGHFGVGGMPALCELNDPRTTFPWKWAARDIAKRFQRP